MNQKENIIISWIRWHFSEVPSFLLDVWGNFLWANVNYFSVPVLVATFFAPWRRYRWYYPHRLAPIEWMSTFISNGFSRFVGAFLRFLLIITGIITIAITVVIGAAAVVVWVTMPFILCVMIVFIIAYG